jgi:malonyl CoA-acyl carrier protein transacylase
LKEAQQKPDFVAGHSLGEYSALFAAGVFDFKTGLELVKKRGELMSQIENGGMAAILGLKMEEVKQILQKNNMSRIAIANHNSYTQIVVSGPKNDMVRACLVFENIPSVSFIALKVSGAFHSEYMLPVQQQFETTLQQMTFSVPHMPVIANINAEPYHPAITCTNLAKQLSQTVRWTATIEYFLAQGEVEFKEIGPGIVLGGLVRAIKNGR